MRSILVVKWLRAVVLSALLLVPQSGPSIAAWSAASAGTVVLSTPSSAWARSSSSSKSSGGYSRPSASSSSSSSSSSRTPSASSSSSSSSGSSGYTRPRTPSSGSSAQAASQSASDKAISRQGSSDALARYRDSDKPKPQPATTTTTSRDSRSDSGWSWGSGSSRRPSTTSYSPSRGSSVPNWYSKRGWSPSSYMQGGRNFGMWDAMFLWFMLDSLTKPSHAAFFHNHQNDPGVQQWRTEAERLAKDNKELAAKLAQLDKSKAALKDQPIDSSVMPSDVPIDVATGSTTGKDSSSALRESDESGGGSGLLWVVLILGAVLALLWLARRRKAARKSNEEDPVRLGMVGNYISQKISGKPYEPSLFRVGMTVTIDPTPFLLSAGLTKVKIPEGGLTSIPKLSKVTSAGTTLHRLYLPDVESFFQLHLDKDGMPDECRYFSVIDQVTPADEAEWGFWLDRAEGMIGWPEFQTKDGKLYPRAWTPGSGRIKPLEMKEELKDVRGTNNRTVNAMLYATPTGGAAPAPENEYILVSAIEEGGQAWVEIAAGIDVSPASLSLT